VSVGYQLEKHYFRRLNQDHILTDENDPHFNSHKHTTRWNRFKHIGTSLYSTKELLQDKTLEYIKSNQYFIMVDNNFHVVNKLNTLKSTSEDMVLYCQSNVYNPIVDVVSYTYSASRDMLSVAIKFVSSTDLQESFTYLQEKYEKFKEVAIEKCNNVIKVTLQKESIEKYGGQIKQEVEKLLKQIRTMDMEKAKKLTNSLYKDAIKAFKLRTRKAISN